MARKAVPPKIGPGLETRHVTVAARNVVRLKSILEGYEGLAQVFAEAGGELTIVTPTSRSRELDEVLAGLLDELGGIVATTTSSG